MNSPSKMMQGIEDFQTNVQEANESTLSYDEVLEQAYSYISDNTDSRSLTLTTPDEVKKRQEQHLALINQFVDLKSSRVKRDDSTTIYSFIELRRKLVEDITQFGPITPAYVDPEVSEIQINDYQTIWIERKGELQIMRDEVTGARVMFKSPEECLKTIQKLLRSSKASFNETNTLAKARTLEGYRVAAVHPRAAAGEKGKFQARPPSASAVIRKFPESNITAKDLVMYRTITAEMGNYLQICPKADVTILVAGPTGGGKTTLIQLALNNVPRAFRIYAVENPSELGIKQYDSNGYVINNVLQFEALADSTPEDQKDFTKHTEIALMMQALRMSPHYYVFGEMRLDTEINQAMTAANTGHKFISTTHAPNPHGAVRRVMKGVVSASPGLPAEWIMEDVCSNIDFIWCQQKDWDGGRRLFDITEVCGIRRENGVAVPNLRQIFVFIPERREPGAKKIKGSHWQVNEFSDSMKQRMMSSVMDITEYDLINKPLEKDTDGNPIPRKGHYEVSMLLDMERVRNEGAEKVVPEIEREYARVLEAETVAKEQPAEVIEQEWDMNGQGLGHGTQDYQVHTAKAILTVEKQLEESGHSGDLDLGLLSKVVAEAYNQDVKSNRVMVSPETGEELIRRDIRAFADGDTDMGV